ncbi:MAG: hypothetical protein CVU85_01135 [Firmicutes bacterium HGW-Firmicutes-10]|jgi:hypothetical protein|nr:MAG: hypothetical protein CVU85_01135 [Firmicutes bacterium HGW-Firmicutes-10]
MDMFLAISIIVGGMIFLYVMLSEEAKSQIRMDAVVDASVARLFQEEEASFNGTNGNDHRPYFVEFVEKDNKRNVFPVKKNVYSKLNVGDSGRLTYNGFRFIEFTKEGEVKSAHQTWLENFTGGSAAKLKFYAFAPSVNMIISTEQPTILSLNQVKQNVRIVFNSTSTATFGVENENGDMLHFTKVATGRNCQLEIPDITKRGSYWLNDLSESDVSKVLDLFSRGEDLISVYELTLQSWHKSAKNRHST